MLLSLTALIALASVPAAAQAPQTPAAPAPCRVSGIVVDSQTRAGVAGAAVTLRGAAGAPAATDPSARNCAGGCEVSADPDGRFTFGSLVPGTYAVVAAAAGFSESAPVPVTLTSPACEASVEIVYRFQMRAESTADVPAPPEATPISGAIAPVLTGEAIFATPGALEDVFRALQASPGVAASQDNRNDLLVRGGGAIENQTRVDGFDVPNPNHFGAQGGTGGAHGMLGGGVGGAMAVAEGRIGGACSRRRSATKRPRPCRAAPMPC